MGADADTQQALRQIFDRLGGIDAKLVAGSQRHEEFSHSLADLDGKVDKLSDRVGGVEQLAARIPVIEPVVWSQEGKRLEAQGVKKLIGGVFKVHHLIMAVIGAVLAAFGIHIVNFPK